MKKCPFCKAEIEDHARFCLYCMKTLEEKQVIMPSKPKKKRWFPLVLGAAAVLALLCLPVILGRGTDDPPPAETGASQTQGTEPNTSAHTEETPPSEATMEVDSLGHSYRDGYCVHCSTPDYDDPKVVFSYREVGSGDYFTPGSYTPGSDIVITGVKELTPDGIYEVPSCIDGKKVVGILSLAFSGTDARKITLGENIIRVNQNAFSGCLDLEALYIRSDTLFLSRSAFVTASQRNCKLTIYGSADCTVDDDLYGDCHLKEIVRVYGAEYQEL